MSAANFETFSSGTFHFDVGQLKTRFTLHKKLVSRLSDPLDRLMHAGLKESQLGVACIKDVDVNTFARFAEYVYSGDYSSPGPILDGADDEPTTDGCSCHDARPAAEKLSSNNPDDEAAPPSVPEPATPIGTDEPSDAPAEPDSPSTPQPLDAAYSEETSAQVPAEVPPEAPEVPSRSSTMSAMDRSVLSPALSQSTNMVGPNLSTHVPFPLDPAPGPNDTPSTDYSPVFMCHADVYILAQQYLIPELKTLAAMKLSDSLGLFHCYSRRASDIARLIRHVYSNTPEDDNTPVPLREVVVDYASNNFRTLVSSSEFGFLLAEEGRFAPDLCSKVAGMVN